MSVQEKQDPNSAVGNIITSKKFDSKNKNKSKLMKKIDDDLITEVKTWSLKVKNFFEF